MEDFRDEFTKRLDRAAELLIESLRKDGMNLSDRQVAKIGFGVVAAVSAAIAAPKEA